MAETIKIELLFRDDVQEAPRGKIVVCWGNGGWRFMRCDDVGQWRSIMGLPKRAPKMWAELPKEALSG